MSDPVSLAASVQIALDRLAAQPPAALQLLTLAAYLAPEPIPLTLFSTHPGEFPDPLAAVGGDPLAFTALVRLLRAAVPEDPWDNPPAWPVWRQLLPHVLVATDPHRTLAEVKYRGQRAAPPRHAGGQHLHQVAATARLVELPTGLRVISNAATSTERFVI